MTTIACPNCESILESAEPISAGEALECPGCGCGFPAPAAGRRLAVAAPATPPPIRPDTVVLPRPTPLPRKPKSAIRRFWAATPVPLREVIVGLTKAAAIVAAIFLAFVILVHHLEKPNPERNAARAAVRAKVRPMSIALSDAIGRLGIGGCEYLLIFANHDKDQWHGDLAIQIQNTAGRRVAGELRRGATILPGGTMSVGLRGEAGDRVQWVASTDKVTVASGASRLSY
jgi:hypothetical protein